MNGRHNLKRGNAAMGGKARVRQTNDSIRAAIQRAKVATLFEHLGGAGEHGRLLRLALNEAEALAWQTEFPHLVFPELAREKAQAALVWHERQRSLRRGAAEVAFPE